MRKKNPKFPTVRAFGQRSIAPCFKISNPNPFEDSPENQSKKVEKCASFSDFLDSKLNKSVLFKPKNIEEKSKPFFTSLLSSKDLTQLSHGVGKAREEQKKSNGGLEKTMLQQFKPKETEKSEEVAEVFIGTESLEPLQQTTAEEIDHMIPSSTEINEDIIVNDDKILRKRKDPFEGMESRNKTGKPVLILGDNLEVPKPKQVRRERRSIISSNSNSNSNSNKKHRPNYNHYANGSGWWDGDMEGVDSEEVGHSEVWEGVGSTTFGDTVDWH